MNLKTMTNVELVSLHGDVGAELGRRLEERMRGHVEVVKHDGKTLRKVERKCKTGDYVRFSNIFTNFTKNNKFYEVINNDEYIGEDKGNYLVYGWKGSCPNPEIFEVVDEGFNPGPMNAADALRYALTYTEWKKPKSPNQQRAELIQRAREFVENNQAKRFGFSGNYSTGNSTRRSHYYEADFVVKGNRVTALVYWLASGTKRFGNPQGVGRATCMPGDVFNEWIGKAIALARALEIEIPVEFLRAVQPTEIAIGQMTKLSTTGSVAKIVRKHETVEDAWHRDNNRWDEAERFIILDDTDAIYEEGN